MNRYLSNIPWCNFQELLVPFGMFIFVRIQTGFAIISRKGKFNLFLIVWGHLLQKVCHLPDVNSNSCKFIYAFSKKQIEHVAITTYSSGISTYTVREATIVNRSCTWANRTRQSGIRTTPLKECFFRWCGGQRPLRSRLQHSKIALCFFRSFCHLW